MVSHDRYFLERVCDDVWSMTGGTLKHLPGGVDQYLADSLAERTPSSKATSGDSRAARKELARIERELTRPTPASRICTPRWPRRPQTGTG